MVDHCLLCCERDPLFVLHGTYEKAIHGPTGQPSSHGDQIHKASSKSNVEHNSTCDLLRVYALKTRKDAGQSIFVGGTRHKIRARSRHGTRYTPDKMH
jgi:hypothetical protein